MNVSLITSPRTPDISIRSPTVNTRLRSMTKYPATDVTTFCRANASPAVTSPAAVVSRVGSSNHIDSTPSRMIAAEIRFVA